MTRELRAVVTEVEALGPVLQVRGDGLYELAWFLAHAKIALRDSGDGIQNQRQHVFEVWAAAVRSAQDAERQVSRHVDLDAASSELPIRIGSSSAADLLGLSQRSVQRRASSLGGQRAADGRRVYDRDLVIAVAKEHEKGSRWPK